MREETITIKFVRYLRYRGWNIISYDFPQSGTGLELHPDNETDKTKGIYIPDVIAYKDGIGIVTENKVDYDEYDIQKLANLKYGYEYDRALNQIFNGYNLKKILYGVVLNKTNSNYSKLLKISDLIDFAILYNNDTGAFEIIIDNCLEI